MRQTAKLTAAQRIIQQEQIPVRGESHEAWYEALIVKGYAWDAGQGNWKKTNRPIRADGVESISIFTDDNGQPTGIYRLRVMSHPDEIGAIVSTLRRHLTVIEVSEKEYPNHKGAGVRMYLTCKLEANQ